MFGWCGCWGSLKSRCCSWFGLRRAIAAACQDRWRIRISRHRSFCRMSPWGGYLLFGLDSQYIDLQLSSAAMTRICNSPWSLIPSIWTACSSISRSASDSASSASAMTSSRIAASDSVRIHWSRLAPRPRRPKRILVRERVGCEARRPRCPDYSVAVSAVCCPWVIWWSTGRGN